MPSPNHDPKPPRSALSFRSQGGVEPSPLSLWRSPHPDIDAAAIRQVSGALERFHVLHEPRWADAIGEDASAAIGIALRNIIPTPDSELGLLDLVMSAVLIHSARGNSTAKIVLEHGRKCI